MKVIIKRGEGYNKIGPICELNSNENNAIVKHIKFNNIDGVISTDAFSTLYHIGNVNQRKLIKSI